MAFEYLGSRETGFEYWCRFLADEEIIGVYNRGSRMAELVVEVRSNFMVKGRGGRERERVCVGSERFGTVGLKLKGYGDEVVFRGDLGERLKGYEDEVVLRGDLGERLRDYWLSERQIVELMKKIVAFAGKERRPTVVDLEVCTLQQEGETMEVAAARAMRPDYLALLHLRPRRRRFEDSDEDEDVDEAIKRGIHRSERLNFLGIELMGLRVYDLGRGLSRMQACGICGGEPFLGSWTSKLRCGHVFHYHCTVRRLDDHLACPICRRPPYDPRPYIPLPDSPDHY